MKAMNFLTNKICITFFLLLFSCIFFIDSNLSFAEESKSNAYKTGAGDGLKLIIFYLEGVVLSRVDIDGQSMYSYSDLG